MVLLGWADLGMIQGCHTDVEMAFDLIHIQLVIGMSPGKKTEIAFAYPYSANHLVLQKALKIVLKSHPSQ